MEDGFTHMMCGKCGIEFYVPSFWQREKKDTGDGWFCPNGHSRVYRESEADKQRRRAEWAEHNLAYHRSRAEAAERSVAAHKGQITKLKKRAAGSADALDTGEQDG